MDFPISDFTQPAFWYAVAQIIGVNIILSGDNAVVIALACRMLPPRQRLWGMILGAGVAVLLRIVFTVVVAQAMAYPWLKLVGGILLLWVAVKLVVPDESDGEGKVTAAENLWRAVWIVTIADIVMSLDNVIAIAASAEAAAMRVDIAHAAFVKTTLIIFGLATSVPLIIAGSAALMLVMERFPILVWAGAGLLGLVAGDIMIKDDALLNWFSSERLHDLHDWAGRAGAIFVVGLALLLLRRRRPLSPDETYAGAGLVVWLVGEIAIDAIFAPGDPKAWLVRGSIFLLLGVGYFHWRSRREQIGTEEL